MLEQIKSQFLGITLAILTAIGIISYERIVKAYSYSAIAFCNFAISFVAMVFFICYKPASTVDIPKVLTNSTKDVLIFVTCYVATSFIWFYLTLTKNVMTSSLFEIKYIVVLAIIYVIVGEQKMTMNMLIGVVLALSSIYFITK
jgi:drug/metabolite transporter (DMT)-like permease